MIEPESKPIRIRHRVLKRVIVESPYDGEKGPLGELPLHERVKIHTRYARACMLDCLRRDEAPYLSHLLYPQVLPDEGKDRALCMAAGFAWGQAAQLCVVYEDLGVTMGMDAGIINASMAGLEIERRTLGGPYWKISDLLLSGRPGMPGEGNPFFAPKDTAVADEPALVYGEVAKLARCKVCHRVAPLNDGECPDCRH